MIDHDAWLLREAERNCHDTSIGDEVEIVDGLIDGYSLEDAHDVIETWITDITKVMTEDECKTLIKRFLHNGNSQKFVDIEIENMLN